MNDDIFIYSQKHRQPAYRVRPVPKPVRESQDMQAQLVAIKAAKAEITQAAITLQLAKQKFETLLGRLLETVDLDPSTLNQVVGDVN